MKINPDIRYYASGGPPKTPEEMIKFCEDQLLLARQDKIIIDRITPISQIVYNSDKLSFQDLEYLADMCDIILRQEACTLVYCRPSNEHLLNPKSHDWKEYDTPEHIEKILNNQARFITTYDQLMSTKPQVVQCNFEESEAYVELAAFLAASESSMEVRNRLKYFGGAYCV